MGEPIGKSATYKSFKQVSHPRVVHLCAIFQNPLQIFAQFQVLHARFPKIQKYVLFVSTLVIFLK